MRADASGAGSTGEDASSDGVLRDRTAREMVVRVAGALNGSGLNRGTSGNVSVRVTDGMLITPSAMPYDDMEAADLIRMTLDGRVLEGTRKPSSEWRLHGSVLAARPDVDAVVHAHPTFCTTLACLRRGIPPFHYMVAVAGGDTIECARYETFGTPALAEAAVEALEGRTACLLANHGMLALGGSPSEALALAVEVEALAEQYWRALQVGEPVLLTDTQMNAALAAFADYRTG